MKGGEIGALQRAETESSSEPDPPKLFPKVQPWLELSIQKGDYTVVLGN